MLRQVRELIVVALVVGSGCTKETPAATTPPAPTAPSAAAAPAEAPYQVSVVGPESWKVGQAGRADVQVKALNGFHVNPDYPVAFTPGDGEGVHFDEARVKLAPGDKVACTEHADESCQVTFPLPATPEKPQAKLSGVLAFSVCSADKCLIEKVPLTLAINAVN